MAIDYCMGIWTSMGSPVSLYLTDLPLMVVFCRNTGATSTTGAAPLFWLLKERREDSRACNRLPTIDSLLKALYCHVSDYQRPSARRSHHGIHWKHALLHRGFLYHHLLFALAYEATLPAHAYFKSGRSRYTFLCFVSLSKVRLKFY